VHCWAWPPPATVATLNSAPGSASPAQALAGHRRREAIVADGAVWRRALLYRVGRVALLVAALVCLAAPGSAAGAAVPQGVWLIDGKVAVQIFDCEGLLCGRILWLRIPRDPQGQFVLDKKNPDPAWRKRRLCGLTILWGLRSTGPDRWGDGWFYNPDDGRTYSISAKLEPPDLITARIYVGFPLFGETKTLLRVAHGTSAGWC
jgi:uncharacterized protein (DUF2147 family)